ncbi:MAG: leucine-rich repeat domain-containing protein [Candidatus Cloacimonetes bacterium]|nr:leucine-rich repeat domain-containing protein [Candidatus Cloacimonadota bacterium]
MKLTFIFIKILLITTTIFIWNTAKLAAEKIERSCPHHPTRAPEETINVRGHEYRNAYDGTSCESFLYHKEYPDVGVYDFSENLMIRNSNNTLFLGCGNTIIPSNVNTIGWAAFKQCPSFTSINIPSNVKSIGRYAFFE